MADVEQIFVTCEIHFGQNVCELMFGIKVYLVKQPIQSNVTCDDTGTTERERVTKKKRTSEGSNVLAGTEAKCQEETAMCVFE